MKSRAHTAPTTERPTAASQAVPPSADPSSTEKTVVTSGHDGDDSPPKPGSIGKKSAASVNTKSAASASENKKSARTKIGGDSDSDGGSDAVADDSPPKPVSIDKKSAASTNTKSAASVNTKSAASASKKSARTKIVGDGVANAIDPASKVSAVSKESATKGGRGSDSDGDSDAVADDSPPKAVSIGKKSVNKKSVASVNKKSVASASVNKKLAASVSKKSARTKLVGGSDSDGGSDAVADASPPKPVSIGKKSAASANTESAASVNTKSAASVNKKSVASASVNTKSAASVNKKSVASASVNKKLAASVSKKSARTKLVGSGGSDSDEDSDADDSPPKLRKRAFEEQVANSDEVHAAPTKKSKHVIVSFNSSNLAGSVPDRDLPSSQTSSSLGRAALSGPGLHVRVDDPARAVSEMNTSGSGASRTGAIQPATARALGKRKAQTHHDWEEDEEDEADNSFLDVESLYSSDDDIVICGVRANSLQPGNEGVVTRSQECNLAEHGVRVVVSSETLDKDVSEQESNAGPEREYRVYRITRRRQIGEDFQYYVLWAEGDISKGTWEWASRLKEDGQQNRMDAVDLYVEYMEKVEALNKTCPPNRQKKLMKFAEWANASKAAKRLLSDDGKNRCMFDAMRTILEEGLGWMMPFSDEEAETYCEESGIGKRGLSGTEFMAFFRQVNARWIKKHHAGVDLRELNVNRFKGKGLGVNGLWALLNDDKLEDGWYFCGAIDSSFIGHAFPVEVDGDLAFAWVGGEQKPLGTQESWVWRMTFVLHVVQVEGEEAASFVREPANGKGRRMRRKRGGKKNKAKRQNEEN